VNHVMALGHPTKGHSPEMSLFFIASLLRTCDYGRMRKIIRKLRQWRYGVLVLSAAFFVLGIPSLPSRKYHLLFWAAAVVIEVFLIAVLRPITSQSD
jgi:hypothetical protein